MAHRTVRDAVCTCTNGRTAIVTQGVSVVIITMTWISISGHLRSTAMGAELVAIRVPLLLTIHLQLYILHTTTTRLKHTTTLLRHITTQLQRTTTHHHNPTKPTTMAHHLTILGDLPDHHTKMTLVLTTAVLETGAGLTRKRQTPMSKHRQLKQSNC
jgi:hypothetical protein